MPAATAGLAIRELNIALLPCRLVFALETPSPAALGGILTPGKSQIWGYFRIQLRV
jgi:hypothetical protein